MAITAETRTAIIQLVVTAYDAAPGTTLLTELVALVDGGGSLADVATNLTTRTEWTSKYPSFQTSGEFGAEWLGALIPEATAETLAAGVTTVEGLIAGGSTFAEIILAAQGFLADLPTTDAAFGTSAANFANKVTVATYQTISLEEAGAGSLAGVTSDVATVATANAAASAAATAVASTTIALTNGLDMSTAGAGNDTFAATAATVSGATVQTLNAGDNLKGGDGTDTLTLSNTSATAAFGAGVTTSGIESLSVNAVTATSVDAALMAGLTHVTNNGSLSAVTVTGLTTIPEVSVLASSADTTVTLAAAAAIGTADEMTVNLSGASTASGSIITALGVEKFNVNATGTASGSLTTGVVTLNSTTLKDVVITGTAASALALDLAGATATVAGSVTGNDAANTVVLAAAGATDIIGVDLGAGNDVLSIASVGATYTLAGGDGTDTLASSAAITATTGANISGFEVVSSAGVSIALPTATNTIVHAAFTGTAGASCGSGNRRHCYSSSSCGYLGQHCV